VKPAPPTNQFRPEVRLVTCANANGNTMTDNVTIHAILIGARGRIQAPAQWCQNYHFVLNDGEAKFMSEMFFGDLHNVKACCADGALILQCGGDQNEAYQDSARELAESSKALFDEYDYTHVNDCENGHARIMKALDHAIERLLATQ